MFWCLLFLAAEPAAPEFKTSLAVETDEAAWEQPGFRIGLAYGFDTVFGVDGVPGGGHHSISLSIGARLDDRWSLFAGFRYGARPGEFPGIRFSGTIEPSLDLGGGLTLTVGLGIGGFVIPATRDDALPPIPPADLVASLTIPSPRPLLGACAGAGAIALVRLDYRQVVNDLLATGPAIQVDAQWTRCEQQLGLADPDTGQSIELAQFWQHHGMSLAWVFWWR